MAVGKGAALIGSIFVMALGFVAPAEAQATRTWVSGVGDDVNPCSRTAPCKTFAGAISKTAAGGEINCLDPGGFGAVTIVKAMTISCLYTEGGVLAGGNGIVVNAGAADVIYLKGLDIFGVNPPSNGVRFLAGGALHIEDSQIRRFNAANSFGISFQPSGASRLYINNTTIATNGTAGSGGGILIQPTGAGGSAKVEMNNVRVQDNANVGLKVDTAGNTSGVSTVVSITESQFSGSPTGVSVNMNVGNSQVSVLIVRSVVSNNTSFGVSASGTATANVAVSATSFTGNGTAVQATGGGLVRSFQDNLLDGNANASSFSGTLSKQ